MNKAEILIIDDEPQIRKLLEITLQSHGFSVNSARSAREGLALAGSHPPELILLDLGLPDQSGQAVLKSLRQWYTNPIIIISVQKSEEGIIEALDAGANDYISKPFRTGELLARIRAALRQSQTDEYETVLRFEHLEIDLGSRSVRKNNQLLKFTSTEYNLLVLLAKNEGKVLTHHYLLRAIWGPGYIDQSQYLRVFIAQIRKKIEDDPNRPTLLLTESGVGYRFLGRS